MRRIKDKLSIQPVDFRYDEGIRGRSDPNLIPTIATTDHGISGTPMIMQTQGGGLQSMSNLKDLTIRKLTGKECYNLMGFNDADFEKCAKIQNEGTIKHQAGDSIVTTVLVGVFCKLLNKDHEPIINEYVETLKKQ